MTRYRSLLAIALLLAAMRAAAEPVIGISTHVGIDPAGAKESLDWIGQAGFGSVRDDLFWSHVERSKGKLEIPVAMQQYVEESNGRGLQVMLLLGYGNDLYGPRVKPLSSGQLEAYLRYVEFVATALRGKVWAYAVWNEWDWKTGGYAPGTPADYVALVQKAAPLIRRADPQAKVLSSAVTYVGLQSGWLIEALKLGLADSVDGLAMNPYVQSLGPGRDTPDEMFDWIGRLVPEINAAAKRPMKLYLTEVGWSTTRGFSRERAAEYASRTIERAREIDAIGGLWWYNLRDDGRNPSDGEHNYGLIDHDFKPKPAFWAIRSAIASGANVRKADPAQGLR